MARRHHLVPQMYLRHFANDQQVLALVDRDDLSRSVPTTVRRALSEAAFYELGPQDITPEPGQDLPDPELVENSLAAIEADAAPALHRLAVAARPREGVFVDPRDWFAIVNLIALQTVRGNRFREDLQATATQAARVLIGERLSDERLRAQLGRHGGPVTQADVEDFRHQLLLPGAWKLVPSTAAATGHAVQLGLTVVAERLADEVEWVLIESDQEPVLTSDEPVCWWARCGGSVGWVSAEVVWWPVSRRRLLQLRLRGARTPGELGLPDASSPQGRDELVRFVNAQIATQAHRWVVHHPDDDPLAGLALGPRTAWDEEVVSRTHEGSRVTEVRIHRRLPVVGGGGTSGD